MIRFKDWKCELDFGYYGNGNVAIKLIDALDGDIVAVATVNIPNEELDEGEVIIKDYAENSGVLNSLLDANIITPPHRFIKTGYVQCPVCKLR
jgi:hypothetical protein